MDWGQFKDLVYHMSLAGSVVASGSLTQEMAGSSPLTVMTNAPGGVPPCPGGSPCPGGFSLPRDPPVNRITHTCKNITLATTSLRPVINKVNNFLHNILLGLMNLIKNFKVNWQQQELSSAVNVHQSVYFGRLDFQGQNFGLKIVILCDSSTLNKDEDSINTGSNFLYWFNHLAVKP